MTEPPGPKWTSEQLRAIERREGNLLLDAGAGSGKTSVLVERFVRAVLDDGLEVASMLTITFTEKAAAELRDRIRLRLRELGAFEPARATESAFISTIHGFCARVLRSHALTAGLDPGFVVLDRSQSEPLSDAAFDDALSELARDAPDAVDLLAAYGVPALRSAILAVHGQLRSSGEITPRLPAAPPIATTSPAELEAAARALAAELTAIADPGRRLSEALGRVERCLDLIMTCEPWPSELGRLKLPGNGATLGSEAGTAYGEALTRFRAVCAARAAAPLWRLIDRLLGAYGARYAERKREISGVDFEDLELLTRELLRGDGELRERYVTRFERIMVDEFQDTNRVQLELIELIARGNLFTVGDAQQSIYGFRHADVELFERRGERLAARGERETLQTNFRSRAEILEALNLAFEAELGDRFKPLRAGRAGAQPASAADSRVELVLVDKGADWALEGLASPWRLAEARALANRVAELVAGGTAPGDVVLLTRATTDMRAYERALEGRGLPTYVIGGRGYWSHPQVLDLVAYLRALANPRDEESLYTVLASPLVGASWDALVVLAAAARARERDPWWLLREPGDDLSALGEEDGRRLAEFARWFAAERERSLRTGIERLIDRVLELTGYDLEMLAMAGGRRRLANVRKLMRLGREHESEHGVDLRGFLDLIGEREAGRAADSRESEAPVEGEGLDAIRLMTIHRAKGLEFDTVCVADLGRSPWRPNETVRLGREGREGRVGLRLIRAGVAGRESAYEYDELGEEQLRAAEREERRLFYVAMTRAKERLVLSGATRFDGWTGETKFNGGGPIAWIAPAFVPDLGRVIGEGGGIVEREGTRIAVRIARPEEAVEMPDVVSAEPRQRPAAEAEPAPEAESATKAGSGPSVATLSYSALGEHSRCGYRFYAERVLGLPPAAPLPASAGADPTGPIRSAAERGVLLHALLERLDFRRPRVPAVAAVTAVAAYAGLSPLPGPAEAEDLGALVAAFAASDLGARLGRCTEVRREQRFAFLLAGGALVTGALDVLAREPGGRALIVDYKSDRLAGADPAAIVRASYATQRLIYALAALRNGAETVEIAYCFLERPSEPVTSTFPRSRAPELEADLQALAGGVLGAEFAVAPEPYRDLCTGCPAEGGLCSWPSALTRRETPDRLF